jgi:hypothetical protein
MSITVDETKVQKRAGWSVQGGRTYSLQVRVISDEVIGPRQAILACNIPVGSTYRFPLAADQPASEWDFGACLQSVSAESEFEDGLSYLVVFEYGPFSALDVAGAQPDDPTFTMNPLQAAPTVKWSSESEEIACVYDRDGVPILNKAGDPFDPPLIIPLTIPIATVTRPLASFDPSWIADFQDHVNDSEWMGYEAGTVRCKSVTADRIHDNDWGWIWMQTLTFSFRPKVAADDGTVLVDGWASKVLNAGVRQLDGSTVKQILIDGSPASSPVALTSSGAYDPSDASVPNYLTFNTLPTANFDGFGLPDDVFSVEGSSTPVGGS